METALLDTSVIVALHQEELAQQLPANAFISAATLAELHTGVLIADTDEKRITRLDTLLRTEQTFIPLPIDVDVARKYAEIVSQTRAANRRPKIFDTLIAATALSHHLPVVTCDRDFLALVGVDVILLST